MGLVGSSLLGSSWALLQANIHILYKCKAWRVKVEATSARHEQNKQAGWPFCAKTARQAYKKKHKK